MGEGLTWQQSKGKAARLGADHNYLFCESDEVYSHTAVGGDSLSGDVGGIVAA